METPTPTDAQPLEDQLRDIIREIYDPEIPVNIYDLGLIYDLTVNPDSSVLVTMTLTAPNCPAADMLPQQVEARIMAHPDVTEVRVDLTFDPPYTMDMMSDEAKLELGFL